MGVSVGWFHSRGVLLDVRKGTECLAALGAGSCGLGAERDDGPVSGLDLLALMFI